MHPRPRENQTVLEYELDVSPTPDSLLSREDYFGNEVTFFSIAEPHRELIITSRCLADLEASTPPALELSPALGTGARGSRPNATRPKRSKRGSLFSNRLPSGSARRFAAYAAQSFAAGRPLLSAVEDLSRRIFTEFHYDQARHHRSGLRWMRC